ncbi:12634_t:CDS:1, partial [Racocetra persica]
ARCATELFVIVVTDSLAEKKDNMNLYIPEFLEGIVTQYQDIFLEELSKELLAKRS